MTSGRDWRSLVWPAGPSRRTAHRDERQPVRVSHLRRQFPGGPVAGQPAGGVPPLSPAGHRSCGRVPCLLRRATTRPSDAGCSGTAPSAEPSRQRWSLRRWLAARHAVPVGGRGDAVLLPSLPAAVRGDPSHGGPAGCLSRVHGSRPDPGQRISDLRTGSRRNTAAHPRAGSAIPAPSLRGPCPLDSDADGPARRGLSTRLRCGTATRLGRGGGRRPTEGPATDFPVGGAGGTAGRCERSAPTGCRLALAARGRGRTGRRGAYP